MQIGFIVNSHREDALKAAQEAAKWLTSKRVEVKTEAQLAPVVGLDPASREELAQSNLVVAFGGDGTLIRAAHICSELGTPILGVYFGRFGFVTQCDPKDVQRSIEKFLAKEFSLETRMMLQADLVRGDHVVATLHNLNESVLQRTVTDRMLTFDVEVNGSLLTRYPADGVMVSTPTGSTGYNLSAGGPVVDPNIEALILTAVAPHTLSARPLVLGPKNRITLKLDSGGDSVLSGDGQTRLHLLKGDEVRIQKSPRMTNLVSVADQDFLEKLRYRLLWSKSVIGNDPE